MSDDARLAQILDAAYACFTRHGVRRTTMDDIARESGLSRPGVYQYVRNKDDAFRRLTARLLDAALAESRAAAESPGELSTRLTRVLKAKLGLVMHLWRDSPAHAAELLSVDTRLSTDLVAAYDGAMRDLLAEAVAVARPGVDAAEVAELLLALTRGLEADLSDPALPLRRLDRGVALIVAGLDHPLPTAKDLP